MQWAYHHLYHRKPTEKNLGIGTTQIKSLSIVVIIWSRFSWAGQLHSCYRFLPQTRSIAQRTQEHPLLKDVKGTDWVQTTRRPWCFLNQTCLGAHRHLLRDFWDTEHCWWQKVTLDRIPHDTVTPLSQMVCQRVSNPNWCLYFFRSAHWGQGPLPFTRQKPLSSSYLLGENCILSILIHFFPLCFSTELLCGIPVRASENPAGCCIPHKNHRLADIRFGPLPLVYNFSFALWMNCIWIDSK